MKKLSVYICAVSLVLATAGTVSANLIVNGSFERGDFEATYYNEGKGVMLLESHPYAPIDGWAILDENFQTSGGTSVVDWDESGAFGLTAQHGNFFLDLTDDEQTAPGGVGQMITTIPGQEYMLTFWLGSDQRYNPDPFQPTITVNIDDSDMQTFVGKGYLAGQNDLWEQFNYSFVASNDVTRLILQGDSIPSGLSNYYVGLDNVSVAPVPEPATMLLLGTGLLGLAAFRRRFKK